MRRTEYYLSKKFLDQYSQLSSSVCAVDMAIEDDDGDIFDITYFEIASCDEKVKLHVGKHDTREDFRYRLCTLREQLDSFIEHLDIGALS